MAPTQTGDDGREPQGTRLEDAIDRRLRGIDSDRYRENTETVLRELAAWLRAHRDVETVEAVDDDDCRRWVQTYLHDRVAGEAHPLTFDTDREFSAASAHTYYNIARAFFSWCVDGEQLLATNPMQPDRVKDELPEDTEEVEQGQQFWSADAREALLRYVDTEAHDALDDDTRDHERAFRDRAIAYLLADTGARGAELFAVSGDSDRNGIQWRDLGDGAIRVLGKSRDRETVQFPPTTRKKVARYRRVLEPASEDWPVIPTADATSKYRAVRQTLADREFDDEEIEALLDNADNIDEVLRAYDVAPPALTTEGARRVMRQLCEDAGLAVDGEYLKPHGGRRGLGHRAYTELSAEDAQNILRHRSIETTHASYTEANTSDLSEDVDDLLYGDDSA
ncbi:tyrosine-type recombinase/integrase (plasmid) [Halarchaeum sp. CBA1220]|uniref:tyrosine-type recombinase/integrase n=1 Tax=Halarchaeum sp. CBA1220 TaxID=1853682 RepID=UPI000F3A8949|nr:site-specific integrase [Halarchaeum sp. CBA1220]QLC35416.1 tyrosine-type recombinase/integrase [Halarchaeum sp. CBA1220]